MADIIENLKIRYKTGNTLMKLLFINVFVFLCLKIIDVIFILFNLHTIDIIGYLAVPSDIESLGRYFWTAFTYMFVHENFFHILFNMLWLYWFGSMFLQFFSGRTLGSLYILGGLSGALLYLIAFNTIPYYVSMGSGQMIGASAAVMAIVMGVSFYRPDMRINLLFIGSIKIIYIAIGVFFIDFLSLGSPSNPGGHIAHIGGAIAGYLFAIQYKKGTDITGWISKILDAFANIPKLWKKQPKMKVSSRRTENDRDYNYRKRQEESEIDTILDKLKQSGYSSLTEKEKKRLFDASKK